MRITRKWQAIAFAVLCLAGLSQCGGKKTKSDGAHLTILPDKPIVILGDTVDSSGKAVPGPWFSFRVNMSNETDSAITITALVLDITGQSDAGTSVTTEIAFSPTDFNYSLNSETECKFTTFGTWNAGTENGFSLVDPLHTPACNTTPAFFVGGNPGKNTHNFRYQIVAKPIGWFGTYDLPVDRFDKEFRFYTQ